MITSHEDGELLFPSFVAEANCEESLKVAAEDVKRKGKKWKAKTWHGAVILY